jgi:hypothetical protein
MREHRNPRQRLSKRPSPDNRRPALPEPPPEPDDEVNCLLDVLRDNIRRADAFISTAERQIEESWHDDDGDESDVEEEFDAVLRHRMRVEYLVEAGKLAVRAALYTTGQLDAAIARKRGA